jgi:hypothetical protein
MPKHHYVPRMLLKNFAVDEEKNFINIHLLKDDRFLYSKTLYGQAQEDDLYGSDQKLEQFFSKMESDASLVIAKLKTGNINLFEEEQWHIKIFMLIQLIRTPGFITMQDNSMEKLFKYMASYDKKMKNHLDEFGISLNEPYKQYFSFSIDLLYIISDLRIGLLEADNEKSSFLIGQNPVILINPFLKDKKYWIWSTRGLGMKGTIMIMPISPRFSLILYDSLRYTLLNKNPKWVISSSDVEKLNDFQYCNTVECIYSANFINEEKYRQKNSSFRNYRESDRANFEIIGSSIEDKTGDKTEITRTGTKEFPIEQKFGFVGYKINEYGKQIISYNDAKREHVNDVNLLRKKINAPYYLEP